MLKYKKIGETIEGQDIIEMGWNNFALVAESGEIVAKNNSSFLETPYLFLEDVGITHHSHRTEAYINSDSVYHNGHHITCDDFGRDFIDGNEYEYYEYEDYEIKIVLEDVEYLRSTNENLNGMFLSIYKAKNFIELDKSSFIDMEALDNLVSLKKIKQEKESSQNIKRTDIAKLLSIDKDTLYKLDRKIKKENCQKSKKKLDNYIDLYLFRKYLGFNNHQFLVRPQKY